MSSKKGSTSTPRAMTDIGNAQRFAARNSDFVRYVPEWKKWVVWNDGAVWSVNAEMYVQRLSKLTVQEIPNEAPSSPDPTAMLRWARTSASSQRVESMLKFARSEEALEAGESLFDADPMLFNVLNGTINLKTGKLRKHRREDYLTQIAPVEYEPNASFPMWDAFLERMIPDAHLREYVQKAVGYTLTGRTDEQVFFFPFGEGASGKGTFLDAISSVMGEYATSTRFETFLDLGRKDYDIWRHVRSRMVSAQEVREGQKFDDALVKTITGGDLVTAERKYCDPFQFRPQWKLWLAANSRPYIDAGNSGMWRRVRIIPFTVSLEQKERDPSVRTTLSTDPEAKKAILAWMVKGCLKWQKQGLAEPPAVLAACETYRDSGDNFAKFLSEHYVLDPQGAVSSAELLRTYEKFCTEHVEKRLPEKDFFSRLTARRCKATKVWNGEKQERSWTGLRPASAGPPEPAPVTKRKRKLDYDEEDARVASFLALIEADREAWEEAEAARAAVLAGLGE